MPGARVASGERVTLRTVEEEDVGFVQRAAADPEIRYGLGSPVMNREEFDLPNDDETDRFLVCVEDEADPAEPDLEDLRRIGKVDVSDTDWKRPEIGYWLVPEYHGQGYAKEAVTLVLEYVFRTYDAPAVGAAAFDFNDASRGLLESVGFSEEGRQRRFMFVDGAHRDMVRYGLLRSEWREES